MSVAESRYALHFETPDRILREQLRRVANDAARRYLDTRHPETAAPIGTRDRRFEALFAGADTFWLEDIATRQAVGFAVAAPLDQVWWLRELSVVPTHGGRGLGRRLVAAVIEEARRNHFSVLGLSTFRSPPFNAPYYARLGFLEVPAHRLPSAIMAQFQAEVPDAAEASDRVILMKYL